MADDAPTPADEAEPADGTDASKAEADASEAEADASEAKADDADAEADEADAKADADATVETAEPPPASNESHGQPEGRASPYGHWLRIRGDVDQTKALALFLGGLTALLLVWTFVTAGDVRATRWTTTVGKDGTITLTEVPNDVWVDGYALLKKGADELTDRDFKFEGALVTFHPDEAGTEVNLGYSLGSPPLVSSFILPKPGKVLGALVHDFTGPSMQLACPSAACPTNAEGGAGKVFLSSGSGESLQRYQKGIDTEPPGVLCPECNTSLDGEIAIGLPPYNFRWGLLSTIRRTIIGFFIAVLICLPMGIAAGSFPPIKRFVSPIEIAGGYTPPVTLVPLAIALYGVLKNAGVDDALATESARTAFMVVVIAFWLYPLVLAEIESIDEVYINTAYTLGATRMQTIFKVLVPVSMVNIWQHLRATYAIGWASIILVEGFGPPRIVGETGIGFFMVDMQRRNIMDQYFAALLAIVITGVALDYAFKRVGRLLFPYEEAK